MKKNQHGFGAFGVVLALLTLGIIGFVGWVVVNRLNNDQHKESSTVTPVEQLNSYVNNEFFYSYPKSTSLYDDRVVGNVPSKTSSSLLLSDSVSKKQLQRIAVIASVEFTGLDTDAVAKASLDLNKKLETNNNQSLTMSTVSKETADGATGYSYTIDSQKPITFTEGFKEMSANSQGTYGSFMLGGSDSNITKIKVSFFKTSDGNMLRLVGDASDSRLTQVLSKLVIK